VKAARRRIEHEPAFVLHSYPYKETSLVLEVFSRAHGRIGMLARGARRPRSAMRGVLTAFQPLRLSWSGSAELCNLTGAEWSGGQPVLGGSPLMCGFYLNELLMRLLPRGDAHEDLFDAYAASLSRLAAAAAEAVVLRSFERRLLAELGYALSLERDAANGEPIDPAATYDYLPERGPIRVNGTNGASGSNGKGDARHGAGGVVHISGRTLLDVARDDYGRAETREEARHLMRALIGIRLGSQGLHTRSVMMELQEL
jgi:DNA repair protein RecO (recombination protein O)